MPDHAERSARVLAELCADPVFCDARRVGAFVGVRGEVDTSALLSDPRIVLPEVRGHQLVFREPGTLRVGAYGIPEPSGAEVPLDSIDLLLVPAVAIDAQGRRLGQGGGFYDRLAYSGPRLALVFAGQLVEALPVEDHDVAVQGTVTEQGCRWFGPSPQST